ncbi:DUF3108 domain-containing protein [Marinobacter sp. 1Y8]
MASSSTPAGPLKRSLALTAALLCISSAAADDQLNDRTEPESLNPMTATYRASLDKGIPVKGSATRTLESKGNGQWLYRFNVDSFIADIREATYFRWENDRVAPNIYRYSLEGMMIPDRHRSIDFNHADEMVTGDYEGTEVSYSVPSEALDPMGYQLQLRQDLKNGMTEMEYQVVSKHHLEASRFGVVGEEVLESTLGDIKTVKVEKIRAPEKKRTTLMWFAPGWDYLLVRLVQVETDGTRYEIYLESAEINGKTVNAQTRF